jgi:alanine racemase
VTFSARVVEIRELEVGDTVSYDATFRAQRKTRLATIAAGYADGYPRALSNNGVASIRGRLAPIAGIVTMDMIMVDVTDLPCEVGDIAILIGNDGPNRLTAESVAAAGGISPYELLTGLRSRIERRYTGAAE